LAIEGSGFELQADSILVSVGQEAGVEGFREILASEAGLLTVHPDSLQTSCPGVFAGGDVASGNRYVSHALADGRRAALSIAAYLGRDGVTPPRLYAPGETVQPEHTNLHYFSRAPRTERREVPTAERLADFREVSPVLSREEATAEADRCLSCGTCLQCDICLLFCPDLALRKDGEHAEGYYILEQFCKGCGLCAAECPRGVVRLTQEQR
jgi:Pyruvate/2-oxoacid:ferredoxin oxidoreductase delta subunit